LTVALAILVAGVGLSKAPAAAAVLPAANGGVTCLSLSGFVTNPKSCSTANDNGSLSYGPVAQVQGYAFGEGLTDAANFFGYLNYSLEVVGGKPGDVVPLDIAVILKALPISIGYAFSELGVAADGSVTETICSSTCGVGTGVTSFNGILHVNAVSGTVYTNAVHLEVEAGGALGPASDFDGATVSADPHIYVDPSFTDASDYSILLSAGVGNSLPGGVPEPKSWALMLLGFAGLGVLMRSRRRIATVAA
jgi:hypothetical protein